MLLSAHQHCSVPDEPRGVYGQLHDNHAFKQNQDNPVRSQTLSRQASPTLELRTQPDRTEMQRARTIHFLTGRANRAAISTPALKTTPALWYTRRDLHVQDVRVTGEGDKGFVKIVEVGARDGLQNISGPPVPTDVKADLVRKLHATGLKDIEVGSFVRADRVPQMADTPNLLQSLRSSISMEKRPNYQVLVPNMKGLDNLIALEEKTKNEGKGKLTEEIALFVPATDGFCKANNGTTVSSLLASIPAVVEKALAHGYRVRGYVSVVIACPYDGVVSPEQVERVAKVLDQIGCYEISLGDTTGQGSPESWSKLWRYLEKGGLDMTKVAVHAHDTFATSLASIASLLPLGCRIVDSSVAGLGGCPYSPGATGNVATEDVVHLLHEMGYSTGVDLEQLSEVGKWITDSIGKTNESRVGRALVARRAAAEKKKQVAV